MTKIKFDAATIIKAKTDSATFEMIFAHFQPRFAKMAETVARNNPNTDPLELESRYAEALWKVVKAFDPERGNFEHLLNYAIRKASDYVIRSRMKVNENESSLESAVTFDDHGEAKEERFTTPEQLQVASAEAVALADETAAALKERLLAAGASGIDAKAALYLVAGLTDEQVARQVGREGSRNACELWTNRCKKRLAKLMVAASTAGTVSMEVMVAATPEVEVLAPAV